MFIKFQTPWCKKERPLICGEFDWQNQQQIIKIDCKTKLVTI
jgi:hypothetical protein